MNPDVKWFEMDDLRKRSLTKATWIPLLSRDASRTEGRSGYLGHREEYYGAVALIVPVRKRTEALSLGWSIANYGPGPCVQGTRYCRAGSFESWQSKLTGEFPVMEQTFDSGESREWHLSQDIVLGLGLMKEGDIWVCPEEDYLQVGRLARGKDGFPIRLEIRSEHMKDYLCARKAGLLIATFQSRAFITDTHPSFPWKDDKATDSGENLRWEGGVAAIHEGGMPFGEKMAVFHVERTNIDPAEDVPTFGMPGEDETESNSWEEGYSGRKLFQAVGEMWRDEWIPPATSSPRIKHDRIESKIAFVVDNSGATLSGTKLHAHNGWLWFRPSVINALLERRRGTLVWYTENTGGVGRHANEVVHFGVNGIGLINVLAKDIADLPDLVQKIWVAHNVGPDGKVSRELLMSQMEARPASTKAPEQILQRAVDHLQRVALHFLKRSMLRDHPTADAILRQIHRFQGDSIDGIYLLSKELTRFVVDRIDQDLLKEIDGAAPGNLGSIKRLEHYFTSKGINGKRLTAPLVAIYELRHRDAHLPSQEFRECLQLLEVSDATDYQQMARQVILRIAMTVRAMGDLIIRIHRPAASAK